MWNKFLGVAMGFIVVAIGLWMAVVLWVHMFKAIFGGSC
jgi:hypothetical protein